LGKKNPAFAGFLKPYLLETVRERNTIGPRIINNAFQVVEINCRYQFVFIGNILTVYGKFPVLCSEIGRASCRERV
jgi:hypothetical protein